jgi:ketosteroid isomerase-like protein
VVVYGWVVRRRAVALWAQISAHNIDAIPMADNVWFRFEGEHGLSADLRSAEEMRGWLKVLFERFPRVRFEVEEMVAGGPPWSLRVATRYVAIEDDRLLYRGAHFARIRWGRVVEERVLPDTQAVARLAPFE